MPKAKPGSGPPLVVVGGGPAGMIAAARAAERGLAVTLFEKNPDLGRKLAITGGGRCNVTNATNDRHALVERYGRDGVALHGLFARFSAQDMRALLRRFGLETKVEAEQRVFPVTDNASDVRDVLMRYMSSAGVNVRTGVEVKQILTRPADDDSTLPRQTTGILTRAGQTIDASAVVMATGGLSHPETGSTGEGLQWLEDLHVRVRRPNASLVPIRVADSWTHALQGLALEDAALHAEVIEHSSRRPDVHDRSSWGNARRVLTRRGKLLFTHFGLSGPLILNAASEIDRLSTDGHLRLLVDLLPGRDPGRVDRDLVAACAAAGTRNVRRILATWIPDRIARAVCKMAGVAEDQRAATLSRTDRTALARALTGMPCSFAGLMGQDMAIVSSGGVEPRAIDFRSMRVKGWDNLYVLGDLLSFDRRSGGYSLQVCWASGWVAADAAADAMGAAHAAGPHPGP